MWKAAHSCLTCSSVCNSGNMMLPIFTIDSAFVFSRCLCNSRTLSTSKFKVPFSARCPTATAPLRNAALLNIIMCSNVSQKRVLSNKGSTSSRITRCICLNSMLLRLRSIRSSPSQSLLPMYGITFSFNVMWFSKQLHFDGLSLSIIPSTRFYNLWRDCSIFCTAKVRKKTYKNTFFKKIVKFPSFSYARRRKTKSNSTECVAGENISAPTVLFNLQLD